jgi:hypothetical protein
LKCLEVFNAYFKVDPNPKDNTGGYDHRPKKDPFALHQAISNMMQIDPREQKKSNEKKTGSR